jgi:hypothetical protein
LIGRIVPNSTLESRIIGKLEPATARAGAVGKTIWASLQLTTVSMKETLGVYEITVVMTEPLGVPRGGKTASLC